MKNIIRIILTVGIGLGFFCISNETKVALAAQDSKILVDSYTVKEGDFEPGGKTTITVKLRNLSSTNDAKNVTMKFQNQDGLVYAPLGSSNQVSVGNIGKKKTKEFTLDIIVSRNVDVESVPVTLTIEYDSDRESEEQTNECMLYFPVGSMNFEYQVSFAGSTTINANTFLSSSIMNKGYSDITDVKMIITGNVKTELANEADSKSILEKSDSDVIFDIGKISSMSKSYDEFTVKFTKSGKQVVTVSYAYLDNAGEKHLKIAGEYVVNVLEPSKDKEDSVIPLEGKKTTMAWIICVIIFVIATLCLVFGFWYKKKHGEMNMEIIAMIIRKLKK